ncbi:hypothetical protein Nepgr_015177 [Nepenthes gracilis]|uniref:Uncharacterized protein n=1 Tax=Nepenthes gracilis TaxID=150966 RepID=A0AAD3XR25_NEPGR|nr:hypothetical protein Nepgr_015177 [Nepenthes gracilis]
MIGQSSFFVLYSVTAAIVNFLFQNICDSAAANLRRLFCRADIPVEASQMKKLFFFKSSASSSENNNSVPPPSTNKQDYLEDLAGSGLKSSKRAEYSCQSFKGSVSKPQAPTSGNQRVDSNSGLRRSRSFSSAAAFLGSGLGQGNLLSLSDQSSSPSRSTSNFQAQKYNHSSRAHTFTPEKHTRVKQFEAGLRKNDRGVENPFSSDSSRACQDSSANSSNSSSNVSSKVLDLYIDGEQQQERSRQKSNTSQTDHPIHCGWKKPPRIHGTAPASPTGSIKYKPRSHSLRGSRGMQVYSPPGKWVEGGCQHGSPQKLAKHVVERLSQSHASINANMKDFEPDVPFTIADIYDGSLNKNSCLKSYGTNRMGSSGGLYGFHTKDYSSINVNVDGGDLNSVEAEDELDVELKAKFKESEERIFFSQKSLSRRASFKILNSMCQLWFKELGN